ncbi:MAG: sensor histidine kinase [Actinomycetota bacterium]
MDRKELIAQPAAADRTARAAGVHSLDRDRFADLDRRRIQLWFLAIAVIGTAAVAIAFALLGRERFPGLPFTDLPLHVVVALVGGLVPAVLLYVVHVEGNLRKLHDLVLQERIRLQRFEEMDRMRSDFLVTVSHEIRTPLTSIIGAVKTLRRYGEAMRSEDQQHFIQIVDRNSRDLLDLVEQVLSIEALDDLTRRLTLEVIDLRELLTELVSDIGESDLGAGRRIELQFQPDRPRLWGDALAVRRILLNVVDNALQYSESEQAVTIAAQENAAVTEVRIVDRGAGISPEAIPHIFERFRRSEAAAKRPIRGYGLGLYVAKTLIEAHGGEVSVDSRVGEGTTLTLRFPKAATDTASASRG